MYKIIWEYIARDKMQNEFELQYGPNGTWSLLFKKSNHYIKTELLKSIDAERLYYVIDIWKSKKEYEEFKKKNHEEYHKYDVEFEKLKERERIMVA